MNSEQTSEIWQIEFNGRIIDADFKLITDLISRGDLLRMDRVRTDELRWVEAGKVPSLISVFNARDGEEPPKPVVTLTKLGAPSVPEPQAPARRREDVAKSSSATSEEVFSAASEPVCSMHDDVPAAYICSVCFTKLCKTCPASYGGTVKICPYCGAMCDALDKVEAAKIQAATQVALNNDTFGFGDFVDALVYPFRFKMSLIFGALMFMFFSIGQSSTGFGGVYMMAPALACYLLANTLSFGVLSNTIENFAQGKIGENFMPSFDDFSVWDDVLNPFFLSIGAWLVSFGPLFVLMIATFFFLAGKVTEEVNPVQSDAAQIVVPELPLAAKAASQTQTVRELLNKTNDDQKRRVAQSEPPAVVGAQPASPVTDTIDEEQQFQQLNQMIEDSHKAQIESVVGKSPDTKAEERSQLLATIVGYGFVFLFMCGICLVWGIFYFPAACAVAGYTRSFTATLNPAVGIDTVRRLGVDYVKILLMFVALVIMSLIVSGVFGIILSAFDMPGVGNIPAKVISSLFDFYLIAVFSCILGFALSKASDRLRLPS